MSFCVRFLIKRPRLSVTVNTTFTSFTRLTILSVGESAGMSEGESVLLAVAPGTEPDGCADVLPAGAAGLGAGALRGASRLSNTSPLDAPFPVFFSSAFAGGGGGALGCATAEGADGRSSPLWLQARGRAIATATKKTVSTLMEGRFIIAASSA